MSEGKVCVVRRMYEAFEQRDQATILAAIDPAIEVRQTDMPWGGQYRGR